MTGWYKLASYFFLAEILGAFDILSRFYYGDWNGGFSTTTKLAIVLHLLSIGVSLALFWRGFQRTGGVAKGGLLAILMAAYFLSSLLWSVDPSTTVQRGIFYVIFLFGVIGVAANLKDTEFIEAVNLICALCAIASLALLVLSPGEAWMPHDALDSGPNDLRGIFPHKNVLGEVMAAGSLANAHLIRSSKKRVRNFAVAVLLLFVSVLSKSSSSNMIILYVYFFSVVALLFRQGGAARAVGAVLVMLFTLIVIAVVSFPDFFLEMIGKDPTLTGRTELWALVIDEILERPIQGWGFRAFWGPANPVAASISAAVRWGVPHAHNGLLEMLLEVGVPGTTLILAFFVRDLVISLRCLRTRAKEIGITSLICCGAIVLRGYTEVVLLDETDAFTVVFFVLGLLCERALHQKRRQPALIVERHNTEVVRLAAAQRYSPASAACSAISPVRQGNLARDPAGASPASGKG